MNHQTNQLKTTGHGLNEKISSKKGIKRKKFEEKRERDLKMISKNE